MIRPVAIAALFAAAFVLPSLAQDAKTESSPPAVAKVVTPLKLTEEQAKTWIDKQVYSSDDKKVGEVAAFARGTDNTVTEMHIDMGGVLGIGETRVKLMPAQFQLVGDRAVLNLTAAQAKDLPKIEK